MTLQILEKFKIFRKSLFARFTYRADATFELIDGIAGQTQKESAVKVSLSKLFRRRYSSITEAVDNLFRTDSKAIPTEQEVEKQQTAMMQLIVNAYLDDGSQSTSLDKSFVSLAGDCFPVARIYSEKLEDKGFVYNPTKVPGQKPITVGHQYSALVILDNSSDTSHWVVPLSIVRVSTKKMALM
jgi:hypothetical protein